MKWIGIAAALLSFGSAVYGVLHAQADLRERERVIGEQLAAGRSQQSTGDYPTAWESFQRAGEAAEVDGLFGKLLGGLSTQRQTVRTAQEDLAMEWVRGAHAPEGHTFSEITDKVVGVLSTGANGSTGARKADLLAHLGWAYFLKQREGGTSLRPDLLYREGVATDATNPYANVFWGHLILWNNGDFAEARERFAAALASNRVRATVRHFQLAALGNSHSDTFEAEWWRVVDEMHKGGEPFDARTLSKMRFGYYVALGDDKQLEHLFATVPPADHVELQRMLLLQSGVLDDGTLSVVKAAMAAALEAAHKPEESLAVWREVQAITQRSPNYSVTPRVNAAIKRLSAHVTKDQ